MGPRSGLLDFPIAHPDQVEDPVETEIRDDLLRRIADLRLRMERDPEPRRVEHGQIVRSVPDRDRLLEPQVLALGQLTQERRLPRPVDDRALDPPRQLAAFDLQLVREDVVDAETLLEVTSKYVNPPERIAVR